MESGSEAILSLLWKAMKQSRDFTLLIRMWDCCCVTLLALDGDPGARPARDAGRHFF